MANRYWVGGAGTYNNSSTAHWSATSGGASGASAPTTADDVFFDANSGGGTITVSGGNAKSLTMLGFTGTLAMGTSNITFAANAVIVLGSGMTMTGSGDFSVSGSVSITSNGITFTGRISVSSTNCTVNLLDNFVSTYNGDGIHFDENSNGWIMNANNHNVKLVNFTPNPNGVATGTLNMGTGTWEITGDGTAWKLDAAYHTLNASTSTLKFTNSSNTTLKPFFNADGSGNITYYNIWFARGASNGDIDFWNQYTMTVNGLRDTGTVAHVLAFPSARTFTILDNEQWLVVGGAGQLITIQSAQGVTGTHTISCASGIISSDYIVVKHSIATGGADFYAGGHSTNSNSIPTAGSGWIFTASPLIMITDAVTAIKTQTATGNGEIPYHPDLSAILERGFVWSESPSPTISDGKVIVAGTTSPYTGALTGLSPNTLYYVRAYATTAGGTTYGNQVTFTTLQVVVITNPVTDISHTNPIGHGNVADAGGETITERGLVWATTPNPTTANFKVIVAGTTGEFEGPLSSLASATTYYVRAYATTVYGTTYGDNQSFLSKSSLGKVGTLNTGYTDWGDPIYFEFIDRWRSYTDMYAEVKSISGLNVYNENAAGAKVYFQKKRSQPNEWQYNDVINEDSNSLFPNATTDDFDVGRFRIAGFTKGTQIVVHGMEILSIQDKGFDSN